MTIAFRLPQTVTIATGQAASNDNALIGGTTPSYY